MDIRVLGVHMEVGEALEGYVKEHLERHINKYFDTAIFADVHFSKQVGEFCAKIVVNEGVKGGIIITGEGSADDAYDCFNEAVKKVVSQLRKHKEKIKNSRQEMGGLKTVIAKDDI